jgi:hypothetical protein
MSALRVDEQDFWRWAEEQNIPVGEVKRRWGTGFKDKITQVNWQVHKMEEADQKLQNILQSDDMGKMIQAYLIDKNKQMLLKLKRADLV